MTGQQHPLAVCFDRPMLLAMTADMAVATSMDKRNNDNPSAHAMQHVMYSAILGWAKANLLKKWEQRQQEQTRVKFPEQTFWSHTEQHHKAICKCLTRKEVLRLHMQLPSQVTVRIDDLILSMRCALM